MVLLAFYSGCARCKDVETKPTYQTTSIVPSLCVTNAIVPGFACWWYKDQQDLAIGVPAK